MKDVFLEGMGGITVSYVIWRRGTASRRQRVLYVGQGNIRRRIRQHRPTFRAYPMGREAISASHGCWSSPEMSGQALSGT